MIDILSKYPDLIGEKIEKYKFKEALQELMNLARLGNKYLADNEPWKLKKIDEKRTETIMNIFCKLQFLCLFFQNHSFLFLLKN